MKRLFTILLSVALLFNSCVFIETKVTALEIDKVRHTAMYRLDHPVKAHLKDGSLVLYEAGFIAAADTIRTKGVKYDLSRQNTCLVLTMPLSEVASLESYNKQIAAGPSIFATSGLVFVFLLLIYAAALSAYGGMA